MTTENPPELPASRRARRHRSVIARPAPAHHRPRARLAPIPHPSTPISRKSRIRRSRNIITRNRFTTTLYSFCHRSHDPYRVPAPQSTIFYTFSTITRPSPPSFTTDPHPLVATQHIYHRSPAPFFAIALGRLVAVLHLFAVARRLRALFDFVALFCSAQHSRRLFSPIHKLPSCGTTLMPPS